MTPHNHTTFVEGCYRCELSLDEARAGQKFWWMTDGDGYPTRELAEEAGSFTGARVLGYGTADEVYGASDEVQAEQETEDTDD